MQIRTSSTILAIMVSVTCAMAQAQTNTFPASGNVGIGTTTPIAPLDATGTQTLQNPGGGDYLLNYPLGGSFEDPNSGDIIILVPASTGSPVNGSQFEGIIESNRGSAGSWNLNSEWYVSVQSAYTNNTGSILPLSGNQEYASTPTLITCVYNGTTYIGFQTPAGNSSSVWSLRGNWSNGQNGQRPLMVPRSSVTNITTFVAYESIGAPISIVSNGNNGNGGTIGTNVGIGTTSPEQLLQVGSAYSQNPAILIGGNDSNNSSDGAYALLFGTWRDVEANMASGIVATPVWTCCGGYPSGGYAGIRVNNLGLYTFYDPANPGNYSPQLYISGSSNNVGIGTTNPQAKLEINGNLRFTADGSVQTTAWTGVLCGGDYAEAVDVSGDRTKFGPGDVLVIDPDHSDKFLKSAEPYSTAVLGVYSTKPGVLGRHQTTSKNADEVPMAMVGIVPTKVSAENGAIRPGDLLVTSATPGYAMKGTDRSRMLGAVIGKALGRLDSGTGVIEVGVTLQ